MREVRIIAHRGASFREPENSIAAFERALEMGADVIEMDVRTSKDGITVLMHDPTVSRTTDTFGLVSDMDIDFIRKLKLENGEPVPTLEEALKVLKGRCQVLLDIKDSESVASSGGLVKEMKLWKGVAFSSAQGPWLVALKLRHPEARVEFISESSKIDSVRIGASLKADAVNVTTRTATRDFIIKAHKVGLDVNVWTVNRPRSMRKFIEKGVNGIITDKPDVLAAVIDDLAI